MEAVSAGIRKLEVRQKHLKIADKYGSKGWKVVEEYQQDPLAADGNNEKRLKKAAVHEQEKDEREERKRRGSGGRGYRGGYVRQYNREDSGRFESERRRSTSRSRRRSRSRSGGRRDRIGFQGKCFECGEQGHMRGSKDCKGEKN